MASFRQIFPPIASKGSRYTKIEDRYEIRATKELKIFAIYDGHAGSQISEELSKSFGKLLHRLLSEVDPFDDAAIKFTISRAFVIKDREMRLRRQWVRKYDPGSTAVMAIYFNASNRLYFAHAGDSRAILFRVRRQVQNGEVKVSLTQVMSTEDHKPSKPTEVKRIKAAGGRVTKASAASVERVDGILAVARSFGDYHLKQNNQVEYDPIRGKVSAVPTIIYRTLAKGAEYRMFMASDGLWDEVTNAELGYLAAFPKTLYEPSATQENLGLALVKYVRIKGGDDDVTIIGETIKTQPATAKK